MTSFNLKKKMMFLAQFSPKQIKLRFRSLRSGGGGPGDGGNAVDGEFHRSNWFDVNGPTA